jgi:hypothetical protein
METATVKPATMPATTAATATTHLRVAEIGGTSANG